MNYPWPRSFAENLHKEREANRARIAELEAENAHLRAFKDGIEAPAAARIMNLEAENERLRGALERIVGTWPFDKAADIARAAITLLSEVDPDANCFCTPGGLKHTEAEHMTESEITAARAALSEEPAVEEFERQARSDNPGEWVHEAVPGEASER